MNSGTFGEYRTGIGKEILWEKTFRKSWHKVFIHTEIFMILIQIDKTLSPLIRRLVPRYRCANRNRNSCADSEMIAKPFLRCLRTAPTPSRVRHRFLIFTASSSYVRILCHGKEAGKWSSTRHWQTLNLAWWLVSLNDVVSNVKLMIICGGSAATSGLRHPTWDWSSSGIVTQSNLFRSLQRKAPSALCY